jgi:Protein of unknown function (DUF2783)
MSDATLQDPDGFYEALIEAHAGLDGDASHRLNARLILLMAEQIGDDARLRALLRQAAAGRTRSDDAVRT